MQHLHQIVLLDSAFWNIIWADNTVIAKLILIVIIFLLGGSIYLFWRNTLRISGEVQNLNKLKQNLVDWEQISPPNEEDAQNGGSERVLVKNDTGIRNIREADIEKDLLPGIQDGTIVSERLKSLQKLKNTKSRVNVGVLQQLSEIRDARELSSRVPSYVMSLSMLLGMFGTFIGLTMMVGEISAQLSGFDTITESGNAGLDTFRNSFQGIQDVMKGVGTAFTTTLAGLFCTIVISALNFWQSNQKAKFFDDFEQFSVKDLLPRTFPDMEEKEAYHVIKDQLADTFDNLDRTIENNNETLANINGLYAKFDTIVTTVKDVMATGGTAELHKVLEEMQGVNTYLRDIIDKYQNKRLLEDFQVVAGRYEEVREKYDFALEQAKWLPNARVFMIAIASFLGIISVFLGVLAFS